jgi:hypothetical protein
MQQVPWNDLANWQTLWDQEEFHRSKVHCTLVPRLIYLEASLCLHAPNRDELQ